MRRSGALAKSGRDILPDHEQPPSIAIGSCRLPSVSGLAGQGGSVVRGHLTFRAAAVYYFKPHAQICTHSGSAFLLGCLAMARTLMVLGTASEVGKSLMSRVPAASFIEQGCRWRPLRRKTCPTNAYVLPGTVARSAGTGAGKREPAVLNPLWI